LSHRKYIFYPIFLCRRVDVAAALEHCSGKTFPTFRFIYRIHLQDHVKTRRFQIVPSLLVQSFLRRLFLNAEVFEIYFFALNEKEKNELAFIL